MGEFVKAIKDGMSLFDYAKRAWVWFTQIKDWNSWQGWLARILIVVVVIVVLIWLLRKGLEWFIAIQENWKKAGFPVPMSTEQREFVRRRSQFCKVIRSDLDTLNKAENWNDQFFTDLEAEVEAQGWYYASRFDALFRRRSFGLRRVKSLIKAIETSTEQALLLVGEPGSGKSVALRHLAHQIADRGTKSTELKAKIPLYVNLKELPPPPKSGPNADWIRAFVIDNVRRGDADTADYIKEHWEAHLRNGIWLFLFDSFDEIPAVMHAPAGSNVIRQYAEAIRQFLATMSDCRGVLASREFKGPESLPWQKFRILPLSGGRQDELINNSFLNSKQKEIVRHHLTANTSNLRQNPLFLALLCRYVKQEDRAPINDHDLLAKHINRLAERDPAYTRKKHGLSPTQLMEGAMELAVLFATDPKLSLAPTHNQIAEALPLSSFARKKLDSLLPALVDVKIGRSDVQEAKPGDRRFTFSHRRYQEVLFVRFLALNPAFISARDLLCDQRWREYAVALLQSESSATLKPILEEATSLLKGLMLKQEPVPVVSGFGEGLSYYKWDGVEAHLLDLLQEGLGRRLAEVPQELTEAIENLLATRWSRGDFIDRAMVIRRGGLLPSARLAEYLSFAVQFKIKFLHDAAFESIVFLRDVSPSLIEWIREQLSNQALLLQSRPEQLRLQALGARVPPVVGAEMILRRGSRLRWVLRPLIRVASRYDALFRGLLKRVTLIGRRSSVSGVLVLLDGLVIYMNLAPFALLSEVARLAPGDVGKFWVSVCFLFEAFVLLVSIDYFCRTVVGGRLRDLAKVLGGRRVVSFLLVVMLSVGGLFLPPAPRVVDAKLLFSAVLGGIGALVGLALVGVWFFSARQKKKQLERFNALCAQRTPGPALALKAESLGELQTWLSAGKQQMLPDEECVRSLLRVIICGIQQTPVSNSSPPLVAYLASFDYTVSGVLPPRIGSVVDFIHVKEHA